MTTDRLEAQKIGLDILADPTLTLEDPDDADLVEAERYSFQYYGLDDYGRKATHQPLDTDPYIEVEPVVDNIDILSWLERPVFRQHLLQRSGRHNLHAPDCGVQRYMEMRQYVEKTLVGQFPDVYELTPLVSQP